MDFSEFFSNTLSPSVNKLGQPLRAPFPLASSLLIMSPIEPLNQLFETHYEMLVSWCRRRQARSRDEAEEWVHRAYLRCSRGFQLHRASRERPLAYLYRALNWVRCDRLREQRRRPPAVSLETWAAPAIPPESTSDWQESLDELPPRPRAVCRRILAGENLDQVGQGLQLSVGAVAVALSRARRQLLGNLVSRPAHA